MASITCTSDVAGLETEIVALFQASFSDSEGEDEGALIGALAGRLMGTTPPEDLFVFVALSDARPVGCIIFSRLRFEEDPRRVFLLSPVAISPDHQGTGVGTELLNHGLRILRQEGVVIAVTYGDPEYYRRVGFDPVGADQIPPPISLRQPHGWLAQSLTDENIRPFKGPSRCAEALNDPVYW